MNLEQNLDQIVYLFAHWIMNIFDVVLSHPYLIITFISAFTALITTSGAL